MTRAPSVLWRDSLCRRKAYDRQQTYEYSRVGHV